MHQTISEIARETGIHHLSVYSVIHQNLQFKCPKKRRAQKLITTIIMCILD